MARRPNVVFIIADDHRHDALSCHGDRTVKTPTLDALAASGVDFRRNYDMGGCSPAVCMPARAAALTGVNPFRACPDARGNDPFLRTADIDDRLPTLPQRFKATGYQTHLIGKWHNGADDIGRSFDGGDDIFLGGMDSHFNTKLWDFRGDGDYPNASDRRSDGKHSSEVFSDAAIDFLGRDHDKPFFLWLAYTAPHDPRESPEPYASRHAPGDIPLPDNFMPAHPFDNGELDIRDEQLAPMPRTPEIARRHLADYYGIIEHLDAQLARVLGALNDRRLANDTIVVYTADHGLAVGQHGLLGKQNLYEHSIRVPMIVRGPGVPAGRQVDRLTMTCDLFPTLCALCGVETGDAAEGVSLTRAFNGEDDTEAFHDSVFAAYRGFQRAVITDRWKLIRYYRSHRHDRCEDRTQLFDLDADPWELNDLSGDAGQTARIAALNDRLARWSRDTGDPLVKHQP